MDECGYYVHIHVLKEANCVVMKPLCGYVNMWSLMSHHQRDIIIHRGRYPYAFIKLASLKKHDIHDDEP